MSIDAAKWIPWIPALAAALCGICCMWKATRTVAAWICVIGLLSSFVITVGIWLGVDLGQYGKTATFFEWISFGDFTADFSYFVDDLTVIMLLVVTGVGSLVALYAAGYMQGDRGYARFFMGVALFIFAMTNLVMADNLVLLFLGWEGVGLCSYLLIGYYYNKPSAVAAAKKAFIVNRIGDFGFLLGIFLVYQAFGTVHIPSVIEQAQPYLDGEATPTTAIKWIPFLLMLGAFGKSAQFPLYVWLPDAMEGPTPVSALIHAATMVTAGVYMIARLLPVFAISEWALPTVATIGGFTALGAALIAMCQYDLKRIWAYSTVSQLGYMFLGVGALSATGAVFHLFTHAFFKALLFLTAGSVMHAMAGQLDLRKMSGLRHKMPVTATLMLLGCIALSGFPIFGAGFFSKDAILAAAMQRGIENEPFAWLYLILAISGLITALLTAYYTFRLWFRVFMGPELYEMGNEHSHSGDEDPYTPAEEHVDHHDEHHTPHEMPWWPMNLPLLVLGVGALFTGWLGYTIDKKHPHGWIGDMMHDSTAYSVEAASHGEPIYLFGMIELHLAMMFISGAIALIGIAIALYFHLAHREKADELKVQFAPVAKVLENKFYVDEIYGWIIVAPLKIAAYALFFFDRLVIEFAVAGTGEAPKSLGKLVRPLQDGKLQGYALWMALGLGIIVIFMLHKLTGVAG